MRRIEKLTLELFKVARETRVTLWEEYLMAKEQGTRDGDMRRIFYRICDVDAHYHRLYCQLKEAGYTDSEILSEINMSC